MSKYTLLIALKGSFIQTVKEANNPSDAIIMALKSLWENENDKVISITVTEEINI